MSGVTITSASGWVSMPADISAVSPLLAAYPADLRERAVVAIDHVRSRVLDMIIYIAPDTAWANIEREDIFTIQYAVFSDGFFVLDIDLRQPPPSDTQGTFVVLQGGIPTPIIVNSWNDGPSASLVAGSHNSRTFSADAPTTTANLGALVVELTGSHLHGHAAIIASVGVAAHGIIDTGAVTNVSAVPVAWSIDAISIGNQHGSAGTMRPAGVVKVDVRDGAGKLVLAEQEIQAGMSRALLQAMAARHNYECARVSGIVSSLARQGVPLGSAANLAPGAT